MAAEPRYSDIIAEMKKGVYRPVYLLMGMEDYFIQQIAEYIEKHAVEEEHRDYQLYTFYGADCADSVESIIHAARQVPMMMGARQVVILKEAQLALKKDYNHELFCQYLHKPSSDTVLVICHMHGSIDKRKPKLIAAAKEAGIVFESNPLKSDNDVAAFAIDYMKQRAKQLSSTVAQLLTDHVGGNISRLAGEMDKLIVLSGNTDIITIDHVEQGVGISREFNTMELRTAIINKNQRQIMRIIDYLNKQKDNQIHQILPLLYNYFANLMIACYAPDKREDSIATFMGLPNRWQAQQYATGMRNYTAAKTMQILRRLQHADAHAKGVDVTASYTAAENLRETIHFITH